MAVLAERPSARHAFLIDGFLDHFDDAPLRTVREPWRRVAVALNTHYPEFAGAFFDHVVAVEIARVIAALGRSVSIIFRNPVFEERVLQAVRVAVGGWRAGADLVLDSVEQLDLLYRSVFAADDPDDPAENEPFEKLWLWDSGTLLADVRSQRYDQIGGPWPYHDRIVFEVVIAEQLHPQLLRGIDELEDRIGLKLDRLPAVPKPTLSLRDRMMDFIRNLFGFVRSYRHPLAGYCPGCAVQEKSGAPRPGGPKTDGSAAGCGR